jgi:hypothetical protein
MTVSLHERSGWRSPSQSKFESTTTLLGIAGALSVSSMTRSASSFSASWTYGSTLALSHPMPPSIAFAYGSINSLLPLKRSPSCGS